MLSISHESNHEFDGKKFILEKILTTRRYFFTLKTHSIAWHNYLMKC